MGFSLVVPPFEFGLDRVSRPGDGAAQLKPVDRDGGVLLPGLRP